MQIAWGTAVLYSSQRSCDGVASKLCDPAFNVAMEDWFTKLGGAKPFTTFMCGGVASKLCDPAFNVM